MTTERDIIWRGARVYGWEDAYRPLIGHPVRALAWLPITCDTPGVVGDLDLPHFSFSGAVHMVSENGSAVFLTWTQVGDQFVLAASDEQSWIEHTLDRIHCSTEMWNPIRGAVLVEVELYAASFDDNPGVFGARHRFSSADGEGFFWIGTGGRDFVGDGDDLWVGIDVEPANISDLVKIQSVK